MPRFYDAPKGKAGRLFVTILTEELRGARERRWNSKRPMVFIGTVLAKTPGVKNSKDIRVRLLRKMDHWIDGLVGALVEGTCGTDKAQGGRAGAISERDKKERASMAYNRTVKARHLRSAVRQATNRGKGGVLHVNSTDSKSVRLTLDVLRTKHLNLQEVDLDHPDCSAFEAYSARPKVLPLDITSSDVEIMVRKWGGREAPAEHTQ